MAWRRAESARRKKASWVVGGWGGWGEGKRRLSVKRNRCMWPIQEGRAGILDAYWGDPGSGIPIVEGADRIMRRLAKVRDILSLGGCGRGCVTGEVIITK